MQHQLSIYGSQDINHQDALGMHRLRHEVFAQRLGWDVQSCDGLERDRFDDVEDVAYVLAKSANGVVEGCWRLLPTTGPNMLRDTFPELLHGQTAPCADDCWEMSRFAVSSSPSLTANGTFGPLSKALMTQSAYFAAENGIKRYVTVTTPILERMLKRQGLNIHRIGPPIKVGVAAAVACFIEVDNITLSAVGVL
ncbi:acyl-homoserine-lactone synthase [Rhodoferax aquaticus]|uniref:Acyl-homoserine-lactone synthase n=1 Tax=Rhodoferax aquaticus TaxID=2527691 RepID=A0A515ESY3_9BURK|nr:acyl-homoserine-lactone synthase [Rhodoferax aquaticus]QDL55779.1 GNAT family N-acetyltransferase [Rhodoferax aquaticus]